jgi:outer membrane lipoprotein SlyB
MHGQTADQQDRDHYECSQWATKQTGFDPSAPNVPAEQRIRVVSASPPTGAGTAVGAVAGAILGAAVAGPRNAGGGAIVGAITGGVIGTAAEASSRQQVREVVRQDPQQAAAIAQQASNYRRAIGACLDGRGYSVR